MKDASREASEPLGNADRCFSTCAILSAKLSSLNESIWSKKLRKKALSNIPSPFSEELVNTWLG